MNIEIVIDKKNPDTKPIDLDKLIKMTKESNLDILVCGTIIVRNVPPHLEKTVTKFIKQRVIQIKSTREVDKYLEELLNE